MLDYMELDDIKLLDICDKQVKKDLQSFIKEFNRREWAVRIDKSITFTEYAKKFNDSKHGYGFSVEGKPVPYFHPNRSFHDEIIWLNNNLYYDTNVSFEDKLINSAIVKFYGPSNTIDIITGNQPNLKYLTKTNHKFINFKELHENIDYRKTLMSNIEIAVFNKNKIWGSTELRTSLQTNSRNHSRLNQSIIEKLGVKDPKSNKWIIEPNSFNKNRKMRSSDIITWIYHLATPTNDETPGWINYYKTKPTMKDSFNHLTLTKGIGNYYGYHFSSNLARMPGIGSPTLIEAEFKNEFKNLKKYDHNLTHGNLDENADYVKVGPGAMKTLQKLWPNIKINDNLAMKMIIAIRNNQHEFFNIKSKEEQKHLFEASELGTFTAFGCEISCCQFDVFTRSKNDYKIAYNRSNAPISQELINTKTPLIEF